MIAILREDQSVLKEFGADGGPTVNRFAYKFDQAGRTSFGSRIIRRAGGPTHIYRLKVGKFAYVSSAFPLGLTRRVNQRTSNCADSDGTPSSA